jgi:hypothetical protein
MKKIAILVIVLMMVCVGFLSGCTDTQNSGTLVNNNEDTGINDEDQEQIPSEKEYFFYKQLGEFAYFADPEVAFTINSIKTSVDYISVSDSGYISVDKPSESDYGYLWLYFSAENIDNEMADSPSTSWMRLLVSGTEMSEDTPSYSMSGLYDGYAKINPGAKNEGWIIYSIPKNAKNVQFIYEFSNGFATWNISSSQLVFQERDFNDLADGQSINFGSDTDYYKISITHDKTVDSYEYQSSYSDYVYTENAKSGNKFVFITVTVENMGTTKINVPTPYDMKLIAGGKQYSNKGYYGENSYQDVSGDIYPGIKGVGSVVFEVDDSISDAIVIVELAYGGLEAQWNIDV